MNKEKIIRELRDLINVNGVDNEIEIPDFILADFVFKLFESLNEMRKEELRCLGKGHIYDEKKIEDVHSG